MSTITTNNSLAPIIAREGLAIEKAQAIIDTLGPLVEEAGEAVRMAAAVTIIGEPSESEIEHCAKLRKTLKGIRTRAENARVGLKEDALRTGKAIDACARWVKEKIEPAEERMREVEQHAERAEAARKAALQAHRASEIKKYGADPALYQLGEMTEGAFQQLCTGLRLAAEERARQAIAEEEARKAEQQQRDLEAQRLREENARLEADRKEADRKRKEAEAAARKEREAAEAKAKQEKAKADAKLREEREAREAAEKVNRDREAAEKKRLADEAKAAKRAAQAPDADKLKAFAKAMLALPAPEVASPEAREALAKATHAISQAAAWLSNSAAILEE